MTATVRGKSGVVATGHALASEAALGVLREGGNAADAAAGAGLVLAVVSPHAVTLGGDLFALVFDPKSGAVTGLNASGNSPRAASPARFADGIPANGPLAATVPALLKGIADLLARHGTRDLASLIPPALRLAEEGCAVSRPLAAASAERAALLAKDAAARALFLPGGAPLVEGATLRQPELAAILRAVMADGVDTFYRGAVARKLAAASAAKGCLFDADDLAAHESLWQEPIATSFYGHHVLTMPPNSYGATLLLQLRALEAAGVHALDPADATFVTAGFAARRTAYRQAAGLIADPRMSEAALRRLLAGPVVPSAAAGVREARDRCTTCAVVIDKGGMAVSLIESISAPFGAGVVLDGTGILLNNRMGGFVTDPASANCVAPEKRPANTLAPCLVMKDGRLAMSIGTPGTVGQTCTLAQVLARIIACGQDVEAALAAPRWSVDFQGRLIVEDNMDQALVAALPEARTMAAGWNSFGAVKLAAVSNDGFLGAVDGRRASVALAF